MNTKKYKWVLYLITSTIVITIIVQLYWNYNNYIDNKQRVKNEIQISLDNAIETYYSDSSKKSFFGITTTENLQDIRISGDFWTKKDSMSKASGYTLDLFNEAYKAEGNKKFPKLTDSILVNDSIFKKSLTRHSLKFGDNYPIKIKKHRLVDSLNVIKGINSIIIALTNDEINFNELDSIFQTELQSKNISSKYYFSYYVDDSLRISTSKGEKFKVDLTAKSTYLRYNQKLIISLNKVTFDAVKKGFIGVFISFILSLTIISTLFYLLRIIKKQKELAEIKNDLISNITHEFKTPIATISTAIEAIESFNVLDDKEKTHSYLSMSTIQLQKLNQMVEKLLETATLDSENLMLKKEGIDIVELIKKISLKHQVLTEKKLGFSSNIPSKEVTIDSFHFENSVSNLIDNAIKYGGDKIEINVNVVLNFVEILIADNGPGIEKNQQEKIFDKFYRIPKGNRHDVKGFGIGLYYTKKIVEKHHGKIQLTSDKQNTLFKIIIPNE
tara:strand:- start:24317 stop:25813 length:1497 start_codon:yes stop_codon:yes gene_type:complete